MALTGISDIEAKFNPEQFVRLHRSFIVNMNFAVELVKNERNNYLRLVNNVEVKISETYFGRIKKLLL